ncbi:hypothetical protein ABKN59_003908 [Abortiporus biennis]
MHATNANFLRKGSRSQSLASIGDYISPLTHNRSGLVWIINATYRSTGFKAPLSLLQLEVLQIYATRILILILSQLRISLAELRRLFERLEQASKLFLSSFLFLLPKLPACAGRSFHFGNFSITLRPTKIFLLSSLVSRPLWFTAVLVQTVPGTEIHCIKRPHYHP